MALEAIEQSSKLSKALKGLDQTRKQMKPRIGEFRIWDSLEGLGQNEKWDETHKDFVEFGIVGCLEERSNWNRGEEIEGRGFGSHDLFLSFSSIIF